MNKYTRLLTILPIFCFSSYAYTHDLETAIASNERTPNYALMGAQGLQKKKVWYRFLSRNPKITTQNPRK